MTPRIYLTTAGKHVTAKMAATLTALSREPQPLSALSPEDRNRYHALHDKGLATVRKGLAQPTVVGGALLAKIAGRAPQSDSQ